MGLRQFLATRVALRRAFFVSCLVAGTVCALGAAPQALAASCAAGAVTSMHSPDGTARPFYGDWSHSSTKHSGYVGYELSSSLGSDLWVKLSGFTGGSLGLAANQSASLPARAASAGGNPLVYAYLTASAATTTAQSWTVEVWNGKPGQAGSTQVCTLADGASSVIDVLSAGANKITSIAVSTNSPAIGGSFDVTAIGDTGTMGAGDASDQSGGNGVFSMAPAMDDSWPADSFMLTGVSVSIGGTTTRDKLRIYPGTSAAGAYTAVYRFSVRKAPAAATAVYPVQNIASGTQVKYTGSYPATTTSIAVPTVTTSLVKSTQSLTGPPYAVTYKVVVSNTSASATVLDYLRDTPTSSSAWSFATGTAKLDGSAIPDPVNDAGTLVFSGPFTVPAAAGGVAGTRTFLYTLSVAGTVANSVVGQVGDVVLGGTNAGDNQVTVNPALPNVTTSVLPDATNGASYTQTLGATGGTAPYTWSVLSGTLPAGLTLNPLTGVLAGTPTATGTSSFTVGATDSLGAVGSKALTLVTGAASSGPTDTTAPAGSLTLDGGAATTASASLSLGLSATDATGVTEYRFAEGTDCTSASWTAVTPATAFSATVGLVASAAEGTKTVCVQFGDAAGNISTAAIATIVLDLAPTVSLTTSAASPVNGSFSVTATFSKPVTGLGVAGLVLANATATNLAGSGTTYTFDVVPSVQGAVSAGIGAGAASDGAGTSNTASNTLSLTYDSVGPSVALASSAVSPVRGTFTVGATFSEPVSGLTLAGVAVTGGTASNLTGAGDTYTFEVTPSADGTVTVTLSAGAAHDLASNTNTASTQLARVADITPPSLALSSSSPSTVNGRFSVTASFSEPVTGFTSADVTVGDGAVANFAGTGATYTFDVDPSAQGPVTVDVAAGAASDGAGNASLAAPQLARAFDSLAPTVTLASAAGSPVNGAFSVTASFSESVTGLTLSDISVGNGSAAHLSGSGSSYTFDVAPAADGTVTVDLPAAAASDAAGNPSAAATQLVRVFDGTRPSVSLSSASSSPVNGSFAVTATFSEPVSGFALGALALTNGTAANLSGSGTTYTFDVAPATDGSVTVALAAGAASDAAGNASTAAVSLVRLFDGTPPQVALTSPAGDPTNAPFSVTATFTKSVTGLSLADLVVANGSASALAGSGTTYSFLVTPAADGAVTVDLPAGAAVDAASNGNLAAAQLGRTYDGTRPGVALSAGAFAAGVLHVTATFDEPVTGLALGDLSVAGGSASSLSGSGTTYSFDVAAPADGDVTVSVPTAAANDSAGNSNLASAPLTRTWASPLPAVALVEKPTVLTPDSDAAFTFDTTGAAGVTCSVDGAAASACTSPLDLHGLAAGSHSLVVRVTNQWGAVATTTYSWQVVTPPSLAFTLTPPDESAGDGVFTWDSSTPNVVFTCSLDGAAFASCTSPVFFGGLADGTHTFTVRAAADGVSRASTVTWTVRRGGTPPPASVVIIPKINALDLLGRPQPFKTAADVARSKGPFTRKLNVQLRIPTPPDVGSDVVYISNTSDFRDERVFPIAADELYDWSLLAGPSGDRPVWIRFSNEPDAAVGMATIVLDQELPTLRPTFLGIGRVLPTVNRRAAAARPACGGAARRWLRIGGADGFSGLNAVQVASNPSHPCSWRPFLPSFSYRLPSRVVYVRVSDRVGNMSSWYRVVTRR